MEKIISHRGYKEGLLENSKAAFEKIIEKNLSFETDIRTSKDKVPFLVHDDILDRLFNSKGKVGNYSSEELKNFSYKKDASQKLLRFEELCRLIEKNKNFSGLIFLHIKEITSLEPTIKILEKYSLKEQIRFFAVDEITLSLIKKIKENYQEYKVGIYLPENSHNFSEEKLKSADFVWADEVTFKWISKEKIELSHKLKKPFYAISPDLIPESVFSESIEQRWKELLNSGVDKICTGKVKEFLDFIGSKKN